MDINRVKDYLIEYSEKFPMNLVPRDLSVSEKTGRIITIMGPRRAGKTYYLFQLMESSRNSGRHSLYINFEDTRLMDLDFVEIREVIRLSAELNQKDPEMIFFDEVQNVPKWEYALRELHDTKKYAIYVTGSSSKLLSREIATSLRGRTLSYTLLPFSWSEYLRFKKINTSLPVTRDNQAKLKGALNNYLEWGGFPEVILEEEREKILKQYYDLILFKDIVERHHIKNITLAKFLLSFFLQNCSREISVNKIINFFSSQGNKFAKDVVYDYVDKFQDSIAIFFVSRYTGRIYTRESWPKKIYLCDTGLSKIMRFSRDEGRIVENAVFLHLYRKVNESPFNEIYYYRAKDGKEVDFVIKNGQKVIQLIQVCLQIEDFETEKREISSLLSASEKLNCDELLLVSWDTDKEVKYGDKAIKIKPLWSFLLK
ncbi:MAG: ATP-binding protein [Planctomycetes bacterium]|nr:ATP-binding protein [Planctomycetota bacterium]